MFPLARGIGNSWVCTAEVVSVFLREVDCGWRREDVEEVEFVEA